MSDLWLPNGNSFQTEIEVQMTILSSKIKALKLDLYSNRYKRLNLIYKIDEIEASMQTLKKTGVAVSMRHYTILKNERKMLNAELKRVNGEIDTIKKIIKLKEQDLLELEKKHKAVATKILEFKRGKKN